MATTWQRRVLPGSVLALGLLGAGAALPASVGGPVAAATARAATVTPASGVPGPAPASPVTTAAAAPTPAPVPPASAPPRVRVRPGGTVESCPPQAVPAGATPAPAPADGAVVVCRPVTRPGPVDRDDVQIIGGIDTGAGGTARTSARDDADHPGLLAASGGATVAVAGAGALLLTRRNRKSRVEA